MTTIHIDLSDSQTNQLGELASRESMKPEELAAKIVAEAIAQAMFFEQSGAHADRAKFLVALGKVPDVPPISPDTAVT